MLGQRSTHSRCARSLGRSRTYWTTISQMLRACYGMDWRLRSPVTHGPELGAQSCASDRSAPAVRIASMPRGSFGARTRERFGNSRVHRLPSTFIPSPTPLRRPCCSSRSRTGRIRREIALNAGPAEMPAHRLPEPPILRRRRLTQRVSDVVPGLKCLFA